MIKIFFSNSNTLFSKIVRFLNKSKFSHTGYIDYENGIVLDSGFYNRGVTIYPIDKLFKENNVIVHDFNVSREVFNTALKEIGKPYDVKGVCFFPINRNWQDTDKWWYCSELVSYALLLSGINVLQKNSYRISPQDVWCTLENIKKESKNA